MIFYPISRYQKQNHIVNLKYYIDITGQFIKKEKKEKKRKNKKRTKERTQKKDRQT